MEGTIGLGFDSHRGGGIAGRTAFVSSSSTESNGNIAGVDNTISYSGANNASFMNVKVGAQKDVGSISYQSSTSTQQQQYYQPQQQQQQQYYQPQPQQVQPSFPPPHQPITMPHPLQYSQSPHIQQQLQAVPPSFPPPHITQPIQPSHYFPQPHQMQPPQVPNPYYNSTTTSQQSVSFQPPSGMPPVALSSFPPAQSNVMPPAPIPQQPTMVSHSLPPAQMMMAPSIPAQVPAQHHLQHSLEQNQKQGQQQDEQQQSESIERARAIAMRLHQASIQGGVIDDTTIDSNIDYAQKRQEHFQREKRKLKTFELKNLEYVMKHEEKELRRHVDCMNQMTAYEEKQQLQLQLQQQQQRQRQLQLEQKKQQREQAGLLNDAGGGIGTKEQRHAERMRKRQHSEHTAASSKYDANGGSSNKRTLRTSIYLTNLPTDGSTTERTLQSLFCMYGRLDRVTMYRHRSNGDLKGDGLIVFGRDAAEAYQAKHSEDGLVESVCAQMNGAELPCGTTIGVQPADMDYKKKPKGDEQQTTQTANNGRHSAEKGNSAAKDESKPPSTTVVNEATIPCGCNDDMQDENAKDDDDLDDFFASLE